MIRRPDDAYERLAFVVAMLLCIAALHYCT